MLWRLVLDDLVVLSREGDADPFALAGGRALWEALAEERHFDELAELLGATQSKPDLLSILESLADGGVVERCGR